MGQLAEDELYRRTSPSIQEGEAREDWFCMEIEHGRMPGKMDEEVRRTKDISR